MNEWSDLRISVGNSYPVIASDADRLAVQILDDHGEAVWVPGEFLDFKIPGLPGLIFLDQVLIPEDDDKRPVGEIAVLIGLSDGSNWTATFACFEYVGTIPRHSRDSEDTLYGTLFWKPDLILVDRLTEERIIEVTEHLVRIGAWPRAFERLENPPTDEH
jgi:hypothetical protein